MAAPGARALLTSCVFLALSTASVWSESTRLLSVRKDAFGRLEAVDGRVDGALVNVVFSNAINSTGYVVLHAFRYTSEARELPSSCYYIGPIMYTCMMFSVLLLSSDVECLHFLEFCKVYGIANHEAKGLTKVVE